MRKSGQFLYALIPLCVHLISTALSTDFEIPFSGRGGSRYAAGDLPTGYKHTDTLPALVPLWPGGKGLDAARTTIHRVPATDTLPAPIPLAHPICDRVVR